MRQKRPLKKAKKVAHNQKPCYNKASFKKRMVFFSEKVIPKKIFSKFYASAIATALALGIVVVTTLTRLVQKFLTKKDQSGGKAL